MPKDPAATPLCAHIRGGRRLLLALRDVRYAGGSEYRYRLRVGSFPLVTSVYPAGGRSGAVMSFELMGHAIETAVAAECNGARNSHHAALGFFQRAHGGECGVWLVSSRSQSRERIAGTGTQRQSRGSVARPIPWRDQRTPRQTWRPRLFQVHSQKRASEFIAWRRRASWAPRAICT